MPDIFSVKIEEFEGGAVVNDSPGDCQSRGVTEPAGETESLKVRHKKRHAIGMPLFIFCNECVSYQSSISSLGLFVKLIIFPS